jgi:hypothetical protein
VLVVGGGNSAGEGAAAALAIRRYIQPLGSGMPDHARMMEEAAIA